MADGAQVRDLVAQTADVYGRLDDAVNNAGVSGPLAPTSGYSEADWDRVMAVDLRGVWLCMGRELVRFESRGDGGAVVNVTSILVLLQAPGLHRRQTRRRRPHEGGGARVRPSQDLCQGRLSGLHRDADVQGAGLLDDAARQPTEVARLVAWLCSDAASFVTGAP